MPTMYYSGIREKYSNLGKKITKRSLEIVKLISSIRKDRFQIKYQTIEVASDIY